MVEASQPRGAALLAWVRDGLFDSLATWTSYRAANYDWQTTARQLSLPVLVGAGVLTLLLTWLFRDQYLIGGQTPFGGFISVVLSGLLWFGLGGYLASFLAGKFGGEANFDQAWAALTFASFPLLAGNVLGTLPFVGFLLLVAGSIWSLMLLYQALPVFLGIPLERRVGHFFATIGLTVVAFLVLGALLGALGLSRGGSGGDWQDNRDDYRDSRSSGTSSGASGRGAVSSSSQPEGNPGLFGFGREMDYLDAANRDRYDPPADGRVSADQAKRLVHFLQVANELRDASKSNLNKLEENGNEPSLTDVFRGIKGAISAGTAEMQAVKSGGGNWQEHEWVKRQLFEARLHKDLNEQTAHNYKLYTRYETELADLL